MRFFFLFFLTIATQQSLALAEHYASMEARQLSVPLTEDQLEMLKVDAESVFPDNPYAQWYLITVNYEAYRSSAE